MEISFVFPGQGSQISNMLNSIEKKKVILETIEEAKNILGRDVLKLDNEEAFKSTNAVQLTLFIYEVAVARALEEGGVTPDIVIGHSIGAFAAAVICGSITFKDGLKLVDLRGRLMEEKFPNGYGMGTIIGMNENTLINLLKELREGGEEIYIATINTKNQITVAGKITAIEELFEMVKKIGVRKAQLLRVTIPSHCKLLESISKKITEEMKNVEFKRPKIPFVGNCKARALWNAEDIKEDLSLGLANTVRFYDGFTNIYERGPRTFIECGPSDVLLKMIKGEFKDIKDLSVGNIGIDSIAYLVKKYS